MAWDILVSYVIVTMVTLPNISMILFFIVLLNIVLRAASFAVSLKLQHYLCLFSHVLSRSYHSLKWQP